MRQLSSDQRIIGICKAAVEPLVDDWVDDLRQAAGKNDPERTRIMDAVDARLLNRLNDIADEQGMHGRLRGQFFGMVHECTEDAARRSLETIRRRINQPDTVRQNQGCLPILVVGVAVGLLLLI